MSLKDVFFRQYVSKEDMQVRPSLIYRLLQRFEEHRFTTIQTVLPKSNDSLLDIGCGSGAFLLQNTRYFKNAVGIDVVPELIECAKKSQDTEKCTFVVHDPGNEPLPFDSAQFSTIVSIATLQYIYDLDLLFSEAHRVLKPGGVFILEVPNFLVFWRRFELLLGKIPHTSLFQEGWNGGVVHFFSEAKLTYFVKQHGFSVERITCSGIFSKMRSIFPSLLGGNLVYVCRKI